jgi:DNA-binding SARP family transcriptional activator
LRREDLAELLWPEDFYDATRLRLRQEIHRLKSALREHSELLSTSTQEVAIDRSDLKTDVELMQQALLRPELQLSVFKVLSESVFEPFLPGWDELAFIAERRTAESARANFIAAVAERLIDGGQAEEAQRIAKRLIPDNPLHEPLRFAAMWASASLGSLSGVVAEYHQYRRALKEAKNVDPSDVAEERMQAILRPAETPQNSQSFGGRIPAPIDRLFGRESEMDRVIDLLTPSAPKRLLTLVGPGGIGKTRLAIEVGQLRARASLQFE